MKLFSDNGHQIALGDVVETFRGEEVMVVGLLPPKHPGSSGHVIVQGLKSDDCPCKYYPSVINAHFTK